MTKILVMEVHSTSKTARDAARDFADTFHPPREVVWHVDGNRFHFVDGLKTYKAEMTIRGWDIVEDETSGRVNLLAIEKENQS